MIKKILFLSIFLTPLFAIGQAPTSDSTKLVAPPAITGFTPSTWYQRGGNASNAQIGFFNNINNKWFQVVTGYQFNKYALRWVDTLSGGKIPSRYELKDYVKYNSITGNLDLRPFDLSANNVTTTHNVTIGGYLDIGPPQGGIEIGNPLGYIKANDPNAVEAYALGSTVLQSQWILYNTNGNDGMGTYQYGMNFNRTPGSEAFTFGKFPTYNWFRIDKNGIYANGSKIATDSTAIAKADSATVFQKNLIAKTQYDLGRKLQVDPTVAAHAYGTSYTAGTGASSSAKSFIQIVKNTLALPSFTNFSSGGGTMTLIASLFFKNEVTTNNNTTSFIEGGYNDIMYYWPDVRAKRQITNAMTSMVANKFAATYVAGNDASITYGGTWVNFRTDSSGIAAVGAIGKVSQGSGATATFTTTGNNAFINTIASDSTTVTMDSFTVTVDGTLYGTYNFNGGMRNTLSSTIHTYFGPATVVMTNLGTGSHTIVVTKGTNTHANLVIAAVGTLRQPKDCYPVIYTEIAQSTDSARRAYRNPSPITNLTVDSANNIMHDALKVFQGYPVTMARTNHYFIAGVDNYTDYIHPNDAGHLHISQAILSEIVTSNMGTVSTVSASGTQGVTTSVTNATTTPAITIGLGAITPTSVATGALSSTSTTTLGNATARANAFATSEAKGFAVWNSASSAYGLRFSFNGTGSNAQIQSYRETVGAQILELNPLGGNITIDGSYSSAAGRITLNNGNTSSTRAGIVFADGTNAADGTTEAISVGTNDLLTGTAAGDHVIKTASKGFWWGINNIPVMAITSGGTFRLPLLSTAGILHNASTGNVTSSLVVKADADTTSLLTVSGVNSKISPYFPRLSTNNAFTANITAKNFYSTSTAPTAVTLTNAGTGATISIVGTNQDGVITLTTGTGASNGDLFTVTMSGSFAYPTACTPVLTPQGASILGTPFNIGITAQTAASFTVGINGGVLSSTTVKWNYHNGGY